MARSRTEGKRVVIIGGSFAGLRCYRMLKSHLSATLVDAKGFFEFTPAALRCMVQPSHAAKVLLPLPEGAITATATGIRAAKGGAGGVVELSDGGELPFDFCIVATGSSYVAPIRPDETLPSTISARCSQLDSACGELSSANHVTIVGGGTVGVELAAEVVGKWPGKAVTLVASQERLLARMPHGASAYALRWLTQRGADVVLGERIVDWGDALSAGRKSRGEHVLTTDQGRKITTNLVYKCVGFKPCGEVASKLTDTPSVEAGSGAFGAIPVMETMQVAGQTCVFAVGDCNDTSEEKTALAADLAATCAARNVLSLAAGGAAHNTFPKDVCFGGSRVPDIVNVSLYKFHAVMQFNRLVISGWIPAFVKLMVEFFQMRVAAGSCLWNAIWERQEAMMIWLGKFLFTGADFYVPM